MAVNLSPVGNGQQFFDNNGVPLSGGLLYTYQAGSSTPLATYTDINGTIANPNPIVLNSSGRLNDEVWLTYGYNYKFVLQTSAAVTLGTYDNLYGIIGVTVTSTGTTIPTGVISLWYGSIGSVPTGWYLCDGANGTPDLRDRFVIGAGSTYAVAATGGATTATLVTNNLPAHTHTATSTVTDPGHLHLSNAMGLVNTNINFTGTGGSFYNNVNNTNTATATTGITVATTNASTGSGTSFSVLNPYYALAYIMKSQMKMISETEAKLLTHEQLCAERYKNIEQALSVGEKRMTKIEYLLYAVMLCVLLGPGVAATFIQKFFGLQDVFDPLTIGAAFKAMQLAYDGIMYCCDALNQGKVAVKKVKQATEDAKTIVNEARSIWGFFKGLFSPAEPQPEAKPLVKKKETYTTHIPNETEIVQQFIAHLGAFFRHHKELTEYVEIKYEEVFRSVDPNPEDILELSVYKNELDQAYVRLSGMMRGASVPYQLGPLWDNYNNIYSKVQSEQQKRKEQIRIRRQKEAYQRERFRQEKVELVIALSVVLIIVSWLYALWINSFTEGF